MDLKIIILCLCVFLNGCSKHNQSTTHKQSGVLLNTELTKKQVDQFEENKSVYLPGSYLHVSLYYYKNNDLDQSARYFLLGYLRTILDALGCYEDASAQSVSYNYAVHFFKSTGDVMQKQNKKKIKDFLKKVKSKITTVLSENKTIPYLYDRTWPYNSGIKAFYDTNLSRSFAGEDIKKENVEVAKMRIEEVIDAWIKKR